MSIRRFQVRAVVELHDYGERKFYSIDLIDHRVLIISEPGEPEADSYDELQQWLKGRFPEMFPRESHL